MFNKKQRSQKERTLMFEQKVQTIKTHFDQKTLEQNETLEDRLELAMKRIDELEHLIEDTMEKYDIKIPEYKKRPQGIIHKIRDYTKIYDDKHSHILELFKENEMLKEEIEVLKQKNEELVMELEFLKEKTVISE